MATNATTTPQTTGENPDFGQLDFGSDPRYKYVQETEKWTYLAEDGVTYEYDETKKAWFAMYNEELIAAQQSVYSVPGVDENELVLPKRAKRKNVYTMDDETETEVKAKKQKHSNQNKKKQNTAVYVTGLPSDVTLEEIAEVFSKCGVLMEDYVKGGPRIKIYKDENDSPKGDALITYLKEESVSLAIQLLDDTDFRVNEPSKIQVQVATFKEKEQKPAESSQQSNLPVVEKRKIQKKMQKLEKKLGWFDDETGKRTERSSRMVVLKYMFTKEELEEDPSYILDLKEDIRSECEKIGEVTNVVLYDLEPEGIVVIKFKEQISAEACVLKNNGRFFNGRRVAAEIYDGKTKYKKTPSKSNETEEEQAARLEHFAEWLEKEGKESKPPAIDEGRSSNKTMDTNAYDITPPRKNEASSNDQSES